MYHQTRNTFGQPLAGFYNSSLSVNGKVISSDEALSNIKYAEQLLSTDGTSTLLRTVLNSLWPTVDEDIANSPLFHGVGVLIGILNRTFKDLEQQALHVEMHRVLEGCVIFLCERIQSDFHLIPGIDHWDTKLVQFHSRCIVVCKQWLRHLCQLNVTINLWQVPLKPIALHRTTIHTTTVLENLIVRSLAINRVIEETSGMEKPETKEELFDINTFLPTRRLIGWYAQTTDVKDANATLIMLYCLFVFRLGLRMPPYYTYQIGKTLQRVWKVIAAKDALDESTPWYINCQAQVQQTLTFITTCWFPHMPVAQIPNLDPEEIIQSCRGDAVCPGICVNLESVTKVCQVIPWIVVFVD